MNTWTPLFSKIVDSSLWTEPDWVLKVFLTMLALKDADQVVRFNAYALGRKCWPMEAGAEAKALQALELLSAPDTKRLEPQPYEGRRIKRVEDGWLILNGQHYEDMMRKLNRRAYKAAKQAEYRKSSRSNGDGQPEPLKKKPKRSRPRKTAAQVRALYQSRERRAVDAEGRGDRVTAENIAAEDLPVEQHTEPNSTRFP